MWHSEEKASKPRHALANKILMRIAEMVQAQTSTKRSFEAQRHRKAQMLTETRRPM